MNDKDIIKIQTTIIVLQQQLIQELLYNQTPSKTIMNKLNIITELQQEL